MSTTREAERLTTADLAAAAERQKPVVQQPNNVPNAQDADRRAAAVRQEQAAADAARAAPRAPDAAQPLFGEKESQEFRARWDAIQTAFVDEPRKAVEQADNLVAQSIQRLASVFADERNRLESQWGQGSDVDTEDLRIALQRYRSFFGRLLAV